ncbi:CWF19-like protein 2 [Varroa destructor]|uniref:CWF19-like protein 2 n=1 Tax=Varroa destructor TaxID=109461 RepID=A0A7M7M8K5_VARDE|nr:CWF19-like protein 2 [Varroa destructor]XP_022643987.1 CWF19-like protein 2 [Varroa destructor]XP_022643988.1 CWF19-like protein 2 [Varroa destructor]
MGKHKKKDKKKDKKKHRRRRSSPKSDSDGSSSSWEEVPKASDNNQKQDKEGSSSESSSASVCSWKNVSKGSQKNADRGPANQTFCQASERIDWLAGSDILSSISKDYREEKRGRHQQRKQMERRVDQPGQHEREQNPYWKDGGLGLPQSESTASEQTGEGLSASRSLPVAESDHGQLQWLQRALKRLKEEAHDKGLPVEEVAKERWGSLSKLEGLIREAELKTGIRCGRGPIRYNDNSCFDGRSDRRHHEGGSSRKWEDTRRRLRRPDSDDEGEYRGSAARVLQKDNERTSSNGTSWTVSVDHRKSRQHQDSRYRIDKERKSWRKDTLQMEPSCQTQSKSELEDVETTGSPQKSGEFQREPEGDAKASTESCASHVKINASSNLQSQASKDEDQQEEEIKVLSDTELNKLAAKLLKAEMMGHTEQADKLRKKIQAARKLREENPYAGKGQALQQHEVVILTKTDSRGISRPVQLIPEEGPSDAKRQKKIKPDTHRAGDRMRYFADDDRQSLKEMFEREKLSTAADDMAMFAKMAGRIKAKVGDEDYTVDDGFVEQAARHDDSKSQKEQDANKAIQEHHVMRKALETCYYCLESPACLKHLLISVGSYVALSLPTYESLTEGHCILAPTQHIAALNLADEDVWQEITRFRTALTAMFLAANYDCVFLETAMGLSSLRKPHTVLHCVPVPREVGELLPMYYKKAILESETEWAQNKKLVDLSVKRGLRYSIPKGLPYFAVDFGTDHGFAHVIENEKEFPRHFGLEIVGGLIDCEPRLWLKKRAENFQQQSLKAVKFSKMWSPYEFNEKLV